MMKKYLKFLIPMMAITAVLFVSCQHEENETSEPNPENLSKTSELTGLLKRIANSTTDNDDAIDSTSCVSVKLPYAVFIHDQQGGLGVEYQMPVTNPTEQQQVTDIIETLHAPEDNFTLIFPVTVVFADGNETVVQSQQELDIIKSQCEEPNPSEGNIYCINLNYPVTIFGYDSDFQLANTYTIDSDQELFALIFNINPAEFFAVSYPISVTKSNGETLSVNNNAELLAAIQAAIADCNPVVNPCGNPNVLTDGLVMYIPFANEARDLIGNQTAIHNANYPPSFVTDRSGHTNSAVTFSGNSFDYLKFGNNPANQLQQGDSITVSLWFKMQNTNPSNLEYLFEKSQNGNNHALALSVYDLNKPLFMNYIGAGYNLWDNTWTPNLATDTTNWHHLAVTIDGDTNTVKLYRDGVLANTDVNSSLMIGSETFDYYLGRYFQGYLDDIRVYRKLLTASQIQTLYNLEGDNYTCVN